MHKILVNVMREEIRMAVIDEEGRYTPLEINY